MERNNWKETGKRLWLRLGKFRYPLLMLLLGMVILVIPVGRAAKQEKTTSSEPSQAAPADDGIDATEARLEAILSRIDGAGRVQVMLTFAAGEKTVYQQDSDEEVSTESGKEQRKTGKKTVLASAGSSQEEPVEVQTIPPAYRGAVVVSDGADSAAVRLNLVNAVSSLTGLGADKITVIKMKSD